ncbi:MAG: hypothetical protein RLZ45_2608 [Verrucomicrobiota bacterium]|jgi:putative heme-binding domain-containing protein
MRPCIWIRLHGLLLLGLLLQTAQGASPDWTSRRVPDGTAASTPQAQDGFGWYRAWIKPHDSFFAPHERNLFAESVTITVRGIADAHEVFVNGRRIGGAGGFPPEPRSARDGNHRYKIPPGLLEKGRWNEIAIRAFSEDGRVGFQGEAPFVMNYFDECILEGDWDWAPGDGPGRTGPALPDRPGRAAFDQYHESHRILGEPAETVPGPRLPATESHARLRSAEDLQVDLLLHEPQVAQPTHLSFDARGRLWVTQYRQYPYPAGVKILSRDKYYRSTFDQTPPPPPHHTPGRDRVSIHEDTDGDGVYDRHAVFVDGLNLANAALPDRGGVWILNPPYLLFYPDANGDDRPDAAPVVHLAGFGLEDTHSVANSLAWGPDGWIYGGQGSTTTSRIVRPGLDAVGDAGVYFEGCMVWRYHPGTRDYEIFAEGSGNVFGLEFDGEGRLFSGHNGPETRGWHYLQGGIYLKQGIDPGKFGPPRNPYTFGQLPWLVPASPIQRFTHFLALVEGTALPSQRTGQMFWLDPIHSLVLASERTSQGSTFGTRDLDTVVTSGDDAFRPVFVVNAPDGSLFVADFYEHYIAHGQHYQGQIDPTTGRIYRLRGRNARLEKPVDLTRLDSPTLIQLLRHPNKWHRQAAVRVLAGRQDRRILRRLRDSLREPDAPVEILWTLHQAGALDTATAKRALGHPKPLIREWAVRLLGDPRRLPPGVLPVLRDQILKEPDVRVRAQMASTARRLPLADALVCWRSLVSHDEDATDPCLPLLCWWILESRIPEGSEAILHLLADATLWERPVVRDHLLPRLMRRLASSGRREDFDRCGRLLGMAPSKTAMAPLVRGLEEAFRGKALDGIPETLLGALDTGGITGLVLKVRRRDAVGTEEALRRLRSSDPATDRIALVRALADIRDPQTRQALQDLALGSAPPELRRAAFAALSGWDDDTIGMAVAASLPGLPEEVRATALTLLGSRPSWSQNLLRSVDSGKIPSALIPSEVAESLRNHRDPKIRDEARRLLAGASATRSGVPLGDLERILGESSGNPYAGEPLFSQRCAACHRLFFKGGHLGPDLTAYQRDNLRTLLPSILDPNAEIREGYAAAEVTLKDGRVLQGILRDRDSQVVVLRGLDGQDLTLRLSDVESVQPLGRSLMPEGLLEGLTDTQLRDLFAYLRRSQPFTR